MTDTRHDAEHPRQCTLVQLISSIKASVSETEIHKSEWSEGWGETGWEVLWLVCKKKTHLSRTATPQTDM